MDEGDDSYAYLVGLIERDLFDMAIVEGQRFLERYPDHPRATMARYRLATTLFDQGRRAEATPHFGQLTRGSTDFEYRSECFFRLGQCELDASRLEAAATALQAVLQSGEAYLRGPASFLLGEVDFQAGRDAQAAQRWTAFLASAPGSEYAAAARRGLAWCAWRQGDADGAIEHCGRYLQDHASDPGSDEVRVLFGEALLETGQNAAALEAFGQVTASAQEPAALRGRGFAFAALGQHDQAAAAFARVADRHQASPFAAEADLQRGVELLRAGHAEDAAKALARTASGGDGEALFWLASAQAELGRHGQALGTLDRALGAAPSPELRTRLNVARGDALTSLGRSDEARGAYESAGSDWALHAAAVAALNEALATQLARGPDGGSDQADTREAERLARELIGTYPESSYLAKTQLVLGEALFARGEHAAARASFAAAAESSGAAGASADPADASRARSRLAWCHYLEGNHATAARAFSEVLSLHPGSLEAEEAAYMLARSTREAGDAEAASKATDLYLQLHPTGRFGAELLLAEGLAGEGAAGLSSLVRLVEEFDGDALVPEALFELGERLSALEESAQASSCYQALVDGFPSHALVPRAHYGLGWCAFGAGDFDAAARSLRDVVRAPSADDELRAAAFELTAWAQLGAGRPADAAKAWEEFAQVSSDATRVFQTGLAVAEAWRTAGKPGEALALLDRQAQRLGDADLSIETLVEGTYAALDAGSVEAAEARLSDATRLSRAGTTTAPGEAPVALPGSVTEAAFFVGEACFQAGDLDRAAGHYRMASSPGSPVAAEALYKLGFGQLQAEEFAAAEVTLEALTGRHAGSELFGEALFLLGEARFRQGDFAGAVEPLERLTGELPQHAVVHKARFRLGLALGELGRFDECERSLARLAKDQPDFANLAEAELWRGRALAAGGKARAARQAFDRCMQRDASTGAGVLSAQARLGLGLLAEAEQRFDEALSEYLKVAVLFTDDEAVAEALLRAGTCLERLGDASNALLRYQEVVDKHPGSSSFDAARTAARRLGS
ncbi:MAG: tetratricopeptide repeat protein [Planctomycetota bacterium]|nr:tetratricopeptide repeat protein [Planctomycetota bacterium]